MPRTVIVGLILIPLLGSAVSAAPKLPVMNEERPVEQAEINAYDLTVTYADDADGRTPALILERADERNFYLLEATGKRTQFARVRDGRRKVLASGPGIGAPGPLELTISRRPGVVRAFAGARLLTEAYDRGFRGGACGSAAGERIWAPEDLYLQGIGTIEFEDDFFATDDRGGLWETLVGQFDVDVYWDPKQKLDDRPIGASWFANQATGEHLAVTGADFWDNYACEVTARLAVDSTVGLAFRVHDPANYALLSLSSDANEGVARLIEVRDGQMIVLADVRGPWPVDRWIRLRVEVVGTEAMGFVAGEAVGTVELNAWPRGRVGVYAHTEGDCRFDDFMAHGLRRVEPQPKPQPLGPWTFVQGSWKAAKGRVRCKAASSAIAVASLGSWDDCDLRATTQPANTSAAGLLARWTKTGGYGFLARRDGDQLLCALKRIHPDGEGTVLAEGRTSLADKGPAELRLTAVGPALRGFVDGQCVVRAWDGSFPSGEVGLVAEDGNVAFEGFAAADGPADDAISVLLADGSGLTRPGAQHGAFERLLGELWQPLVGRWRLVTIHEEPCLELNQGGLRYYLPRPGDVTLSADLVRSDGQPVALGICSDAEAKHGYALSVADRQLELIRNGEVVGSAEITDAPTPLRLSIRRDGPFVVAQAGGAVTAFRDDEPPESGYALVHAAGTAALDNLDLGATHALAYRFDRVEPDWAPSSGGWMFHSGMACIPWAHWVSGDGRGEPAVMWNRHKAPADLVVRFDVSEYTVGHASGAHEHFPYHDISLVICAEREEIDSGYRFIIGAERGKHTRLLRNGEVVAETSDPRFCVTMGSHCNSPRAVEVVATNSRGAIGLTLNGVQALTYEDPQPLGAGWVALGAANCRANFRDLFMFRDRTWDSPLGVVAFSPE